MTVLASINREQFGAYRYYLNDDPIVPERVSFAAGVTLTLVLLPLLSSIAFGAISPFALFLMCQMIGALLGVGLFDTASEDRLTRLAIDHVSEASSTTHTPDLKLAA